MQLKFNGGFKWGKYGKNFLPVSILLTFIGLYINSQAYRQGGVVANSQFMTQFVYL